MFATGLTGERDKRVKGSCLRIAPARSSPRAVFAPRPHTVLYIHPAESAVSVHECGAVSLSGHLHSSVHVTPLLGTHLAKQRNSADEPTWPNKQNQTLLFLRLTSCVSHGQRASNLRIRFPNRFLQVYELIIGFWV